MSVFGNKEELIGHVIEDQVKFSIKLGFKNSEEYISSGVFGILSGVAIGVTTAGVLAASAAATSVAAVTATLAGLSVFGKIGLSLGLVTLPVTTATFPIAIPIAAGAGAALGVSTIAYFIKTKGKQFSTYGGYRSFNTNIDRLGHSIAGKIFIPMLGLIKAYENNNYDFVKYEMQEWGYSNDYIDTFIKAIGSMSLLNIKKFSQNYDTWLNKEMKKKQSTLNAKDIDSKTLNTKKIDMAQRYLNDNGFSGSSADAFMKFIEN